MTAAKTAGRPVILGQDAVREDQDVVLRVEISGVDLLREHLFHGSELELFEDPADPARRHVSAIRIGEADAHATDNATNEDNE